MSTGRAPKVERRREPRFRIQVVVEYVFSDQMVVGKGRLRDLSVGGMYIEDSEHDLALGDVVRVSLRLQSGVNLMVLEGQVARGEVDGFAVKLNPLDQRTEARLRAALPVVVERQRVLRRR